MASMVNGSFASPLANADYPTVAESGILSQVYNSINALSVFVTFLLGLVVYDQCENLPIYGNCRETYLTESDFSHVHLE